MSTARFGRAHALGDTLSLTVEESNRTVFVRMAGDFDLAAVGRVMVALDRVDVERTTLVVFDLQQVAFLDAAALRTILRASDHCKDHDIHVKVIKPRGFASRVFTLTRVHRELDLVDSVAPATTNGGHPVAG